MAGAGVPTTFLWPQGAASVLYAARLIDVASRISREQERAADERQPCPRKRLLWGEPILDAGKWHKWAFARWCVLKEGLRSPSNTARSGKWLAARMAQAQQFSASGRLLGERMLAVCNAGIWRMSDDINEATRFETAPKLTTDYGVR